MTQNAPVHQPVNPRFDWQDRATLLAPEDLGEVPHLPAIQALGLPGIIDAHCHWFPENVLRKIWDYFDRHYWAITYRQPPQERLHWLESNGFKRFTTLNYAHRPGMAAWLNDWTVEFCRSQPKAIPFGTFYPEPDVEHIVRRAIEEYHFKGFKLHLRVGDFDPELPVLMGAYEQLQHHGLPLVIHSGSAPEPGRYTDIAHIQRLVAEFPRLKLVIAHMGGWEFSEYLDLAAHHESVYLDTTMVFVGFLACDPFPQNLMERVAGLSDKILFGTDFPNIPYPLHHAVQSVLNLPLDDKAKARILYHNALELYCGETASAAAE